MWRLAPRAPPEVLGDWRLERLGDSANPPAREAPIGSRRRLSRGVCPPCRAALTSAGCTVVGHHVLEGAALTKASDGAALLHHRWATSKAVLPTSAAPRSLGAAASTMKPVGGIGGGGWRWLRWSGKGATGCLLEGSNGVLAVGQVVKRLPRVARRVQACPAHKHVLPAIEQFELEQLLHLVLGHAVRAGPSGNLTLMNIVDIYKYT